MFRFSWRQFKGRLQWGQSGALLLGVGNPVLPPRLRNNKPGGCEGPIDEPQMDACVQDVVVQLIVTVISLFNFEQICFFMLNLMSPKMLMELGNWRQVVQSHILQTRKQSQKSDASCDRTACQGPEPRLNPGLQTPWPPPRLLWGRFTVTEESSVENFYLTQWDCCVRKSRV